MLRLNYSKDIKLLERIRANDRAALGELFVRYERLVFSYIKSHGGSKADAEDMLQETLIVLWQKVSTGKFELTSKLSTFVLAVAKNKWMAEMRKRRRISDEEISIHITDGNPSSLEQVLSGENTGHIRQALDRIHPLCKQLLTLFYFEERNLKDIAKILNFANTDVVKSKKYQCKKALEEAYQDITAKAERRI